MNDKKCYDCVHRGEVPFSAHSSCQHPATQRAMKSPFMVLAGAVGKRGGDSLVAMADSFGDGPARAIHDLNIKGHPYGIKNGWFVWPVNFDPTWLLQCDGFTARLPDPPAQEPTPQ